MGMFDYLKVDYPLPESTPELQETVFQTKNFHCVLDRLRIASDGRLYCMKRTVQSPSAAEYSEQLKDYTGEIRFIGPRGSAFVNYVALVKNGLVIHIERLE